MRVQGHRVSGRLSRDEHLVADAANIDHDMIRAARDNLAADVRDHKTLSRVGAGPAGARGSRSLATYPRPFAARTVGLRRGPSTLARENPTRPVTRTRASPSLTSRSPLRRRISRAARGRVRYRSRSP